MSEFMSMLAFAPSRRFRLLRLMDISGAPSLELAGDPAHQLVPEALHVRGDVADRSLHAGEEDRAGNGDLDARIDEDGDKPVLGQFQQGSMTPHVEELKSIASLFAGETGLTLDDLGFVTSNPSSAEAIKAAHEGLRLMAAKAQRCFSVGFKNVGYIGACIRDNVAYTREELFATKVMWKPVFEPDAAMLSLIGDGVLKLNQAMENGGSYIDADKMRRLTGIE